MKGATATEAQTGHTFPRHMHDQFGIGIMLAGAQDSLSGRGRVRAEAGHVITVNPNEIHDGCPAGCQTRRWAMLYFDTWVIDDVLSVLDVGPGKELCHPVVNSPKLASDFADLYQVILADCDKSLSCETLLMEVLSQLVSDPAKPVLPAPSAIGRAKQAIDDAPEAQLSITTLADLAGLSAFHFLRSFKQATGLPPHAYQIQRRLQMARRLLSDNNSVIMVAAECGFADQAHFTRHFRKSYGLSPGTLAASRTVCSWHVDDPRYPSKERDQAHCPAVPSGSLHTRGPATVR